MDKLALHGVALRALATELQRSLCDVSANAASARAQLEAARLDVLAEMALYGPVDANAECTIEDRCAGVAFEIDYAEAEKRTALETEAVAADDALEALERTGAEESSPEDRAVFHALLARFGPSPLVPVEPTTLNISAAGARAALSGRCVAKTTEPGIQAVKSAAVPVHAHPLERHERSGDSDADLKPPKCGICGILIGEVSSYCSRCKYDECDACFYRTSVSTTAAGLLARPIHRHPLQRGGGTGASGPASHRLPIPRCAVCVCCAATWVCRVPECRYGECDACFMDASDACAAAICGLRVTNVAGSGGAAASASQAALELHCRDPSVIAPRAIAAQDVKIRGLPVSTFVRAGTKLTFEAPFCGPTAAGSPSQLREAVGSLALRLRVSVALVHCSRDEKNTSVAATWPLLPALACECSVTAARHCATITIAIPAFLPRVDTGSWWSLRIAVFLGAQALSLGVADAGRTDGAACYTVVDLPLPGPPRHRGALHEACSRGDTALVGSILAGPPGSFSTEESQHGDTCLWVAAAHGHTAIVRGLLAAGADASQGFKDEPPLLAAAGSGHTAAIEALLAMPTTVDVKARGCDGKSALHAAASRGHVGAVARLLADARVNVNARCHAGKTPLHEALRCTLGAAAAAAAADLLLADSRVDFAAREPTGETPLYLAAQAGHDSCVSRLLSFSDVDINARVGPSSETALRSALNLGQTRSARLLVADHRTDVAAARPTTLLVPSALKGRVEIVALLLSLPAVDVAAVGTAALMAAAKNRYSGDVVSLLLSDLRIDANAMDAAGHGAVYVAATAAADDIVRRLLVHPRTALSATATREALLAAARCGHTAAVAAFFSLCGSVVDTAVADSAMQALPTRAYSPMSCFPHPDALVAAGLTHLLWAAKRGCTGLIAPLLAHPGTDVGARAPRGIPLLMLAAMKGHAQTVSAIAACPSVDVNAVADNGFGALHSAVAADYAGYSALRALLAIPRLDPNLAGGPHRLTGMHLAARHSCSSTIGALLSRPGVDPNCRCLSGGTPLLDAASRGRTNVVALLLAHPLIDANAATAVGFTALHGAAAGGHCQAIRALLAHAGIELNPTAAGGETPLAMARRCGKLDTAALLEAAAERGIAGNDALPVAPGVPVPVVSELALLLPLSGPGVALEAAGPGAEDHYDDAISRGRDSTARSPQAVMQACAASSSTPDDSDWQLRLCLGLLLLLALLSQLAV